MADFSIRGVMLDPARLIEKRKVYRDLLPLLARWGYNAVLWHFADDQGCALKFPSRPEFGSRNAYTPDEMTELIAYAKRYGIEIIPEVETFGHTEFITGKKQYAHFSDKAPGKAFGAMCPFHGATKKIIRDILADAAGLFDSEFIHAGLDEVGFGSHPVSKRLLRTKKKWELFAEHVRFVHATITAHGKRMMMWGDHLLGAMGKSWVDSDALDTRIADMIPKDIVICDWHYRPRPAAATVDFFLKKGFRVIAAPAAIRSGILNHPSRDNLANMRNFSALARRAGRGVLGTITTVWTPYRNFPGAALYAIALGGEYATTGGRKRPGFDRRFVSETFGVSDPQPVVDAITAMFDAAPDRHEFYRMAPVRADELQDVDSARITRHRAIAEKARTALTLFTKARRTVAKNAVYYDDLIFAADCFVRVGRRSAALARAHGLYRRGKEKLRSERVAALASFARARDTLKREEDDATALYRAAVRRWAKTRYPNDPKRDGRTKKYSYDDALTARLRKCAEYLGRLRKEAAHLARSGKGGFSLPKQFPAL